MSDLANIIKQISVDAVEAAKPDKIIKGTVMACHYLNPTFDPKKPIGPGNEKVIKVPIEIQVSDKLFFRQGDSYLLLTGYMRECLNSIYDIHFRVGDTVYLIRTEGGAKYLLLDVVS